MAINILEKQLTKIVSVNSPINMEIAKDRTASPVIAEPIFPIVVFFIKYPLSFFC